METAEKMRDGLKREAVFLVYESRCAPSGKSEMLMDLAGKLFDREITVQEFKNGMDGYLKGESN